MGLERLRQLSTLSWSHLCSKVIALCFSLVERLSLCSSKRWIVVFHVVFSLLWMPQKRRTAMTYFHTSLSLLFGSFEVCFLAQLGFGWWQPPTAPEWPHLSIRVPASRCSLSTSPLPHHTHLASGRGLRGGPGGTTASLFFFPQDWQAFRPHALSLVFLSRSQKKKKKSLKIRGKNELCIKEQQLQGMEPAWRTLLFTAPKKGSGGEGAPLQLCWKEAFSTCFHLLKASLWSRAQTKPKKNIFPGLIPLRLNVLDNYRLTE